MKITATAIFVFSLTLTAPAAKADEVMGYGAITCRTLNGYYEKAGSLMSTVVEQWVSGFLSGLNMASSGRERDITEDAVAKLGVELKAYCAAHPTDTPLGVVGKAWIALPRAKG